jgi:hypothetical protein
MREEQRRFDGYLSSSEFKVMKFSSQIAYAGHLSSASGEVAN